MLLLFGGNHARLEKLTGNERSQLQTSANDGSRKYDYGRGIVVVKLGGEMGDPKWCGRDLGKNFENRISYPTRSTLRILFTRENNNTHPQFFRSKLQNQRRKEQFQEDFRRAWVFTKRKNVCVAHTPMDFLAATTLTKMILENENSFEIDGFRLFLINHLEQKKKSRNYWNDLKRRH